MCFVNLFAYAPSQEKKITIKKEKEKEKEGKRKNVQEHGYSFL